MTERERQDQCVCSNCRSVFSLYDTVIVEKTIYDNIKIKERRCPYCEGSFKRLDVPKALDKYLFINTDCKYYNI